MPLYHHFRKGNSKKCSLAFCYVKSSLRISCFFFYFLFLLFPGWPFCYDDNVFVSFIFFSLVLLFRFSSAWCWFNSQFNVNKWLYVLEMFGFCPNKSKIKNKLFWNGETESTHNEKRFDLYFVAISLALIQTQRFPTNLSIELTANLFRIISLK